LAGTHTTGVRTRLVRGRILLLMIISSRPWPGAAPAIHPRHRTAGTGVIANHLSSETMDPGGMMPAFTLAANTTGGGVALSVTDPATNQTGFGMPGSMPLKSHYKTIECNFAERYHQVRCGSSRRLFPHCACADWQGNRDHARCEDSCLT